MARVAPDTSVTSFLGPPGTGCGRHYYLQSSGNRAAIATAGSVPDPDTGNVPLSSYSDVGVGAGVSGGSAGGGNVGSGEGVNIGIGADWSATTEA
jgi:hypothetical protein